MPRSARIDIPGVLQHVMVRGIERRDIFLDDEDCRGFLGRLSTLLLETSTVCYAWALLPNHLHLLLKPADVSLARLMRRLLTGYAVTFNRRHQRAGHLFQNRYKSLVCVEDSYLLELVRYIHLNPLRAGLVADLDALRGYPWCGHGVLLGEQPFPGQETSEILQRFGRDSAGARRNYLQFIADGATAGQRLELRCHGFPDEGLVAKATAAPAVGGVLGGNEFLAGARGAGGVGAAERLPLEELLRRASEFFQVEPVVVGQPGKLRRVAEVRAVVAYVGVRLLGYPGQDVAKVLALGSAGVTIAAGRGETLWRESVELRESVITDILEK